MVSGEQRRRRTARKVSDVAAQHVAAMTYDYVIAGGGSAGCVLANRLSEDPATRVLLLEAGGSDIHPFIQVPIGFGMLTKHKLFDWGIETETLAEAAGGRSLHAPRGKVLGGSSSINVMAFTRGHPHDYDRWARDGAAGWSFRDALPYFKRSETWTGPPSAMRGTAGPIGVEFARTTDPLFDGWLAAAASAGYPISPDYNAEHPEGFSRSQYSIRDGRRSSTSRAYLRPVLGRRNLTVCTGALAQRILFAHDRATGVAYTHRGAQHEAGAAREVLVCGGAFHSPQLLMLSGIGPADHLRAHDVPVRADLPVGKNLQDHVQVEMYWQRREPGTFRASMRYDIAARNMARAFFAGKGPGTIVPGGMHAFIKSSPELDVPDIEFLFRGAPPQAGTWFPGIKAPYADGFGIAAAVLHPQSRGEVRLRSADPRALMIVDYNFLTARADIETLREGLRRAREVAYQPAMDRFRGAGVGFDTRVLSDADLTALIRAGLKTVSHPAGTCRMGSDERAVVDPELCVRGIAGLRVIDASVLPDLPGAHINAAVIMIAERAADLIRGRPPA
jgi:4-pyridoxate dehydrogenase